MNQYRLSLVRQYGPILPAGHHAVYIISGVLKIAGRSIKAGDTAYIHTTNTETVDADSDVRLLCFTLEADGGWLPEVQAEQFATIRLADEQALMRLDEVRFPGCAIAYRHTHPGPGIRYLLHGELELESDDHTTVVHSGDAWFEDADSPVKATACVLAETTFVRCMILPLAFEGRPTIDILDPRDRSRPMRQVNQRHLDQRIQLVK